MDDETRLFFEIQNAWPELQKMSRECMSKKERTRDGRINPQARLLPHLPPKVTIDPIFPPGGTAHEAMCLIQSAGLMLMTHADKKRWQGILRQPDTPPSLSLLLFSLPEGPAECFGNRDAVRQLGDTHRYTLVEEFATPSN